MALTQKHVVKIAEILSDAETMDWGSAQVAQAFATWLEDENPRFDRERFLMACEGK